jgi:hypothetical protein
VPSTKIRGHDRVPKGPCQRKYDPGSRQVQAERLEIEAAIALLGKRDKGTSLVRINESLIAFRSLEPAGQRPVQFIIQCDVRKEVKTLADLLNREFLFPRLRIEGRVGFFVGEVGRGKNHVSFWWWFLWLG